MSITHSQHLPEWRLKKVDPDRLSRIQSEFQLPLAITKALCLLDLHENNQYQEFLYPSLEKWHSKASFQSLDQGAHCFHNAIQNKKKICVHGDFDTDGMLGTLVLQELLKKLKIEYLSIIPTRDEGHGVSLSTIDKALAWGAELLITVDCGITSIKEVDYANQQGLKVLITDHHLPDEELPKAEAISNPQLDEVDEFKILSGTGVALKLALSTLNSFETMPLSETQFKSFLNQALVLTAIATVADVMELKGLNRALVQHALEQIDQVENAGLNALIKLAKLKNPITVEDLAFQLIPRINSAQRMERGDLIWNLFNSEAEEAQKICEELEALNSERKGLLEEHARHVLQNLEQQDHSHSPAIMVEGDSWLEGFSGLIAQKVIQKYHKPTIVMLKKNENKVVASCRSPEGWHLKSALDQCQDLLEEYGGHAQAAGFRTQDSKLDLLKNHLGKALNEQSQSVSSSAKISILHELAYPEINLGLYENLKILEPHGQGNPKPIFACKGLLLDGELRFLGKDQSHVAFQVFHSGHASLSAIAFGMGNLFKQLDLHSKFDLAFTLGISPYKHQLQLQIVGIRPHRTQVVHKV